MHAISTPSIFAGPGQSGHILPTGATISNKLPEFQTAQASQPSLSTAAELISAVTRVLSETLVKQVDAVFQFEVTGVNGGIYYLDLKHGKNMSFFSTVKLHS